MRGDANALWVRVSEYNREYPPTAGGFREVTFYLGQNVVDADRGEEEGGHGQAG